jgi:DNA-binding transcriptional ArsR family regulator
MSADTGETSTRLSPDDAFAVLGNETRMDILQALGKADGPVAFSELRERVGVRDSGQFNYHLDQLTGHFLRQTDTGYDLRQAGYRVIEAVLSGAVTETVVLEPTRLGAPCPWCGADIEVSYREERLMVRCTECVGTFKNVESTSGAFGVLPKGTVNLNYLPSAGFQGRTPRGLLDTALAWTLSQGILVGNDICPRCSGTIESSIDVCPNHQAEGTICDQCNMRFAVRHLSRCSICNTEQKGPFFIRLLGEPSFRAFFEARGIDPIAPTWGDQSPLSNYEEEILETDPLEARFTFTIDGDELVVTVDGRDITDITERPDTSL